MLIWLALPNTGISDVVTVIGIILFMLGIPAVYSAQRMGSLELIGIILLELAALIALGFRLEMVPDSLGDTLSLTSATLGMLGAVIIGWLTTREHVFPAWVGWLFLVQGVLGFLGGLFKIGSPGGVLPILITLLNIVAVVSYGFFIYQLG